MVTMVVATTTDPASLNPANTLLAMPGWHPGPPFQVHFSLQNPLIYFFISLCICKYVLCFEHAFCFFIVETKLSIFGLLGVFQELRERRSEDIATWQGHSGRGSLGPAMGGSHRRASPWSHFPQQTHCRIQPPRPHHSPDRWCLRLSLCLFRFSHFTKCANNAGAGVPHLKEGEIPPQGGKPGWAAPPNPRIGPWLRLLKNIAHSHNLVPEFEVTFFCSMHCHYDQEANSDCSSYLFYSAKKKKKTKKKAMNF